MADLRHRVPAVAPRGALTSLSVQGGFWAYQIARTVLSRAPPPSLWVPDPPVLTAASSKVHRMQDRLFDGQLSLEPHTQHGTLAVYRCGGHCVEQAQPTRRLLALIFLVLIREH